MSLVRIVTDPVPGPITLTATVNTVYCGVLNDSFTITPIHLNLRDDADGDGQLTDADECERWDTDGVPATGPVLTLGPISDIHNDGWPDSADAYEKLRERSFENLNTIGVIPADTKLEPWAEAFSPTIGA